ncbi:MAG TPA: tetratricopeptide repeat protein [Planktothrix sp.]|jgi:tetratricopeptide (TPR) repeat protein
MSSPDYTWQLCTDLGLQAINTKNFVEAEEFLATALAEAEKFPPGDPRILESLTHLAHAHFVQGKLPEAEQYIRYALIISEAAFGGEHLETAKIQQTLGRYLSAQKKEEEALPLFKRSLAVRRKLLDENDPAVKTTLKDLSQTLDALGKEPI